MFLSISGICSMISSTITRFSVSLKCFLCIWCSAAVGMHSTGYLGTIVQYSGGSAYLLCSSIFFPSSIGFLDLILSFLFLLYSNRNRIHIFALQVGFLPTKVMLWAL